MIDLDDVNGTDLAMACESVCRIKFTMADCRTVCATDQQFELSKNLGTCKEAEEQRLITTNFGQSPN